MFPWGLTHACLPILLPCQSFAACALCLCWECCRHLCARAGRTSPAAAQCSRSPCTALPGSEVTNTEMRLEDTVVALSGLLCSESQEKTKRNLPYPSQALTHGSLQGVHAPQVPCSLWPEFVPYKGWPVSTLTPQANSCTRPSAGKHRPPGAASTLSAGIAVLVSVAEEDSSYRTEHSTFPFAPLGCSDRFGASLTAWGDYSVHKHTVGKKGI